MDIHHIIWGVFYVIDKLKLSEEKFSHCYDFDAGVCDVEYWITDELNNLSEANGEFITIIIRKKQII